MVLGQDASNETKIDGIGATKGGTGRPHAARESGRMGHARLALVALCCISFAPKSCSVEKLVPPKFQVIWTPFGSLKVKNIEKEVFWFSQVNPIKLGNM
jgi:hypothetical protein